MGLLIPVLSLLRRMNQEVNLLCAKSRMTDHLKTKQDLIKLTVKKANHNAQDVKFRSETNTDGG